MKVGKEELVGLLAAFDAFLEEDADTTRREWLDRCEHVADELDSLPGVGTDLVAGEKVSVAPEVAVTVDADAAGASATDVVRRLRREEPRVFVGADSLPGTFTVNPICLTDEEADYVVGRIRENLSRAAAD